MIQQTRLLGISLEPRRNRRLVVFAWYTFVLALTVIPLVFGVAPMAMLGYLPQAVLLGGLLGGIMYGGVVKPYSSSIMFNRNPATLEPITLQLDRATTRHASPLDSQLLDERETDQRDRAHFHAYRILLGLMVAMMLFLWLVAGISAARAQRTVPLLIWLLVVTAFSLPQTVILWTEPEPEPEGSLALV